MAVQIRVGSLDASVNLGLLDCIACGSCAYACHSHIPLVHYFNYAKGKLAARQCAQHKQNETKRLIVIRKARMEALKRAKTEMMSKPGRGQATQGRAPFRRGRCMTEERPAPGPYAHAGSSVNRIMLLVMLALAPATLLSLYLFGWPAILLFLTTLFAALLAEMFALKLAGKPVRRFLLDGSALLTGWLLAMTLPPWAPWWIGAVGALLAILSGLNNQAPATIADTD